MADLTALPNLDQAVAAFRAEFLDLLATHVDAKPNPNSAAIRKILAAWGNFVDGSVAVLQDDYTERRQLGIVRVGARRVVEATVDPEGAIVANPGSIALRSNGTLHVKTSGTGSAGWQRPLREAYDVVANATVVETINMHTIEMDSSASMATLSLVPAVKGPGRTRHIIVVDVSNVCRLGPDGSDTINGVASSLSLPSVGRYIVTSDGGIDTKVHGPIAVT